MSYFKTGSKKSLSLAQGWEINFKYDDYSNEFLRRSLVDPHFPIIFAV